MTISFELPRELLGALDVSEADLTTKLKTLIALELVREGRVSSGKAADLVGISKAEFVQLLAVQGIPYFTETADELAGQVAAAACLLDKKSP